MTDALTYPFRRLWWLVAKVELGPPCHYRWCARSRVGLSVWCRVHTDRILAHESIENWPVR